MTSIAVVTGAGRGLGRLIAERLAARGLAVLCTDIDGDAAAATAT
ncbi:MAG: SDR family NAD(P)-dependent oxidoreductase, partial [Myxococcales bacterium]|nr:SDR family NAD(P)-dependent oxidoreductase [Myxococcales bacterium]